MSDIQPAGTKVLATVGPACDTPEMLESMIRAGVNGFRINFSHGTHEDHAGIVERVRTASERVGIPVGIMGDLSGPKLRLLDLGNGAVDLEAGQTLVLASGEGMGTADRLFINHYEWLDTIHPGHPVLIDDGRVRLRCTGVSDSGIECEVEFGGSLRSRDGVNLPETRLQTTSLTGKDIADVAWAAENGLDYLALSFVCQAGDVQQLRDAVRSHGSDTQIIAKIETSWAVRNLDSIIAVADGTLIARGDLGVEVDVESVPRLQKEITEKSRAAGKPVILATQMLHSMVSFATPTRSEVNDIANSIYDGVDALLLTNETAMGQYPLEAVEMLKRIARVNWPEKRDWIEPAGDPEDTRGILPSLAMHACALAEDVGAVALVVWTESGLLARLLCRNRLRRPVVALTVSGEVQRSLSYLYGVNAVCAGRPLDAVESAQLADQAVKALGLGMDGDRIVLVLGGETCAKPEAGSVIVHAVCGAIG